MGDHGSEKTNPKVCGKLTAAHLAGLRPLPPPESPLGKWDISTAFLAGFAFAALTLPELAVIFGVGAQPGAPHPSTDLLMVLAVVAVIGIFPIVFLQHHFLQNYRGKSPRVAQIASMIAGLALMFFATSAMKPLVRLRPKARRKPDVSSPDRPCARRRRSLPFAGFGSGGVDSRRHLSFSVSS